MPSMSGNTRRFLVLALALSLILVATAFAMAAFGRSIEASTETARHLADINRLECLLATLKEAETGVRGFALTEDQVFLASVDDAYRTLGRLLGQIAEISVAELSTPEQFAALVNRIVMLSRQRMETIDVLVRQRDRPTALDLEALRSGGVLTEQIQKAASKLVTTKQSEVRAVNAKAQAAVSRAKVLLLAAPALGAFMVVLVFGRMNREIQRRKQAETLLNHANETLERRIAERSAAIHAETQLRAELADTLNAVVEGSRLAIVEFDSERRVSRWNPAATAMFGFRSRDVTGQPYPAVAAADRAALNAVFDRCQAGDPVQRETMTHQARDGRTLEVSLSAVPLRIPSGALRGFAFLMEDVTERLSIERRVRRTQRLQSLGELTGGIAHDFNNILNAIVMNLDLALGAEGNEGKSQDFVRAALRSALRGGDLTNRLLTFARGRPLSAVSVDLTRTVTEFVALMRRTLSERIVVTFAPECALWPIHVDPSQLEDAMTNIALNARDAMPQGGALSITARNVTLGASSGLPPPDHLPSGDYVELSFRDSGSGMPSNVLEHALDPFFTTKDRGTGLGLSMVYGFAAASGGHVELFSPPTDGAPLAGTVVRLWLPRAQAEPVAETPDAPLSAPRARGNETLLVVEDQPDVRDVLVAALQALGYRVLAAADGNEALRILETGQTIDLMISDIVMPGGLTGIDLTARARRKRPGLAVVLASGFADVSLSGSATLPEGVPLIAKPYRPAKVAATIRTVLDNGLP